MPEEDPTHLSEEETERVSDILDRTPQIDRAEALRRVIGRERAKRLLDAEAAASRRISTPRPRPGRSYRGRYTDTTDDSLRALREGTEAHEEVSDEEAAAGLEVRDFLKQVVGATGSFNGLQQYLHDHPERTEEARRLGLIE